MNKYQTLREKDHPENSVFPNIDTQNIPDAGVTTAKIADGAITTAKLATGAVTNTQLATDAVDTSNIVAGAVTSTKIGAGAVTAVKIASNAVTTGKINDLAVTTPKIADLAITTQKLMGGAVTSAKIARTWKTLYDIFNGLGVRFLVDAVTELIKLLRDGIIIESFFSYDAMVTDIQSVKFSVYSGEIYIYGLKSGGWSEIAHITSDAEFSTFMSNNATLVYLLVMPQ